jgi:hypothetical protein
MATILTPADLEMFAARIRVHFEPELRDIAFELALGIARIVGSRAKDLRPGTTLDEIFTWIHGVEPFPTSLDQVEWVMSLEEDLMMKIPDDLASNHTTFRDLVLIRARKRVS